MLNVFIFDSVERLVSKEEKSMIDFYLYIYMWYSSLLNNISLIFNIFQNILLRKGGYKQSMKFEFRFLSPFSCFLEVVSVPYPLLNHCTCPPIPVHLRIPDFFLCFLLYHFHLFPSSTYSCYFLRNHLNFSVNKVYINIYQALSWV